MNYSSVYVQIKLTIPLINYYFRRVKILSIIPYIINPFFSYIVDSLHTHLVLIKDEIMSQI